MLKKLITFFRRPSAPQWSHPYDMTPLVQRLGQLPPNDELYPLLLGFLNAQITAQVGMTLSSDASERLVGRLQMCDTLKGELARVWLRAHQ